MGRVLALSAPALTFALATAEGQPATVALALDAIETEATGEVNLILRTTVAQPLGAGALEIFAVDKDGGSAPAFAAVTGASVFATAGDASVTATLEHQTQRLAIDFAAPSGTLNESFGPLVVVRLALAPGLVEDQRFDLIVVNGSSDFRTPAGEPVPTLADRGRLRVRAADPAAVDVGPLGGEVAPGETAVFGAASGRPFAIGSGTIEVLYDAGIAAAAPVVAIDPRYGSVVVDAVSEPEPGRLLVDFHSPDGDLNADLHGLFLAVALPTRTDVAIGTLAGLSLGPATALLDPEGQPLGIEPGDTDVVEFLPPDVVFFARFEEGDALAFAPAP